jgi:preprotein translocase subunit YajC
MSTVDFLLMASEDGKPNPKMNIIFMAGMIAVMYFFMIRPQMKKAKEQKEFSNSTNAGESIVTSAGIYGKIVRINDDGTLAVEIDRNTIIKMDKSAVSMEMTMALRKKMSAEVKA